MHVQKWPPCAMHTHLSTLHRLWARHDITKEFLSSPFETDLLLYVLILSLPPPPQKDYHTQLGLGLPSAALGMGRGKPTEKNICTLRGSALWVGGCGKFSENRCIARQINLIQNFFPSAWHYL